MKFLLIKKCDRCNKRGKHKRYFVGTIQPYDYNGFDLCRECETKFNNFLLNFLLSEDDSDGESVVIKKERQDNSNIYKAQEHNKNTNEVIK